MTPRHPLPLALALLLAAAGAVAQEPPPALRVSSAVAPETVAVGDRFRSVLQVAAPAGAAVEFAPLAVGDTLQPADSLTVLPGGAGEPPVAAYTLVAWVAEAPLRAQVPVRVTYAGGEAATYLVPLRLPVVRSVLPADTAGLRPRPARGELESLAGARPWRRWALLAALALLAGAAAWLLRRRGGAAPVALLPPRARALAEIDRLAADPALRGDPERLYPEVTAVLRRYAAETSPRWSPDLTSRELVERLREDAVAEPHRDALRALLQHADRVKFAGYGPTAEEVERFLASARRWIEAFPPPAAPATSEREAA